MSNQQSPAPSRTKNSQSIDNSLIKQNLTQAKTKRSVGKKLWQLTQEKKELDRKMRLLANRVQYLQSEKQRGDKLQKSTKQQQESKGKVRTGISTHKQYVQARKTEAQKELMSRKKELAKERVQRMKSLNCSRENLLQQNKRSRSTIKSQTQANEDLRKKEKELKVKLNKEKAKAIKNHESKIKQLRDTGEKCHQKKLESLFESRIQEELQMQEKTRQEIEKLSKMEESLVEDLRNTSYFQEKALNYSLLSEQSFSPGKSPVKSLKNSQSNFSFTNDNS